MFQVEIDTRPLGRPIQSPDGIMTHISVPVVTSGGETTRLSAWPGRSAEEAEALAKAEAEEWRRKQG
jgi:broad specificity phosphatase PhoE